MKMTLLGKIMVFVNVALSLVFLFWATGLFQNRIDYTVEHKARSEEIERLKKVLAGQGDAGPGAEARWQLAVNQLKATEARRPVLQKFYADKLELLRSG